LGFEPYALLSSTIFLLLSSLIIYKVMRFYEAIIEMSRWKTSSWKPPVKDIKLRLLKYKNPKYFMSFARMNNKLGINPEPTDDDYTPYGIYAYRVAYALEIGVGNLPYGKDAPYVWIFTARHPRRIKTIKAMGDKAYELWLAGRVQSHTLGMMNTYFLKKNIEGFIDDNTGTIHPHEPSQAVFFGSQTVNIVDVMDNTLKPEDMGDFVHDYDNPSLSGVGSFKAKPYEYKPNKNELSPEDAYKKFLAAQGGKIDLS
jgi:hypothetical protein